MPGKKGVTLKREQWNSFRDAFFDIDEKCVSTKVMLLLPTARIDCTIIVFVVNQ